MKVEKQKRNMGIGQKKKRRRGLACTRKGKP